MGVKPQNAGVRVAKTGIGADADVAVARQHQRKMSRTDGRRHGVRDLPLDFEAAADLALKGVNAADLDKRCFDTRTLQCLDQAVIE